MADDLQGGHRAKRAVCLEKSYGRQTLIKHRRRYVLVAAELMVRMV